MFKFLRLIFFLNVVLSSCISHKKTVYFQEKNTVSPILNDSSSRLKTDILYRVKPGNLLFISISSINREVTEFYNSSSGNNMEKAAYFSFYLVDDSGNVTIPVLGRIGVKDLTLEEVQNKILKKVQQTVTDATVIVKLGSFKVTVLGDVRAPGIVHLEGEKGTIFDAIALSHDILETGNRENVQLIRESPSGEKKITILDLTDKRILNSKNIYLQPDDIVYVPPLKAKTKRDNTAQWAKFIGFTSLLYLVFNLINRGVI